MIKVSNFAENCRNCQNHIKSDNKILETAPIRVSSNMNTNVLLLRNNCFRFGITYLTSCFYNNYWLLNHKNQAALMKSSKKAFNVLLGHSIFVGFFRFPNIWYKFFDKNHNKLWEWWWQIQNVLWRVWNISLPQSLEYVLINCGRMDLDTNDNGSWWSFLYRTYPRQTYRTSKTVINRILSRN